MELSLNCERCGKAIDAFDMDMMRYTGCTDKCADCITLGQTTVTKKNFITIEFFKTVFPCILFWISTPLLFSNMPYGSQIFLTILFIVGVCWGFINSVKYARLFFVRDTTYVSGSHYESRVEGDRVITEKVNQYSGNSGDLVNLLLVLAFWILILIAGPVLMFLNYRKYCENNNLELIEEYQKNLRKYKKKIIDIPSEQARLLKYNKLYSTKENQLVAKYKVAFPDKYNQECERVKNDLKRNYLSNSISLIAMNTLEQKPQKAICLIYREKGNKKVPYIFTIKGKYHIPLIEQNQKIENMNITFDLINLNFIERLNNLKFFTIYKYCDIETIRTKAFFVKHPFWDVTLS